MSANRLKRHILFVDLEHPPKLPAAAFSRRLRGAHAAEQKGCNL
jgi:hypothetical protein